MRVLIVTNDHPLTGHSGVSMYCRDLFPALRSRGTEVGALYVHGRDWGLRPRLEARAAGGLTHFAIVNSPLDPDVSLYHPEQDSSQPAVERLMRRCLEHYRPDVVHVQTLHGYPGAILPAARALGFPTVLTLHDFWTLCPRVLLVRPDGAACEGPDGGEACVRFCAVRRSAGRRLYQFGNHLPAGWCREAFLAARAAYRRLACRTDHGSMWEAVPPAPERRDSRLLERHAARCRALLDTLGDADEVIAISRFVQSVFATHGFPSQRIRILPTAVALEGVVRRVRRVGGGAIRFGFLGRAVPLKGAHIFAQAVRGLPAGRAEFVFFGPASPEAQRYLQHLAGGTPLVFRGAYARTELAAVLDEIDVAVVSPVAREPLGLTTVEAQAAGVPVIGARIGAIPEYIEDGQNGLLFDPGDAAALRRQIQRVLEAPSLVETLSCRARPPFSLGEHTDALLQIYQAAIAKGREDIWNRSLA